MSAVRMDAPNTDYDAAHALLDLQRNLNTENSHPYVWHDNDTTDNKEDMEKAAKLFWNCFIASDIPAPPKMKRLDSDKKIVAASKHSKIPLPFKNCNNTVTNAKNSKDNSPGQYKNDIKKTKRVVEHIRKRSENLTLFELDKVTYERSNIFKSLPTPLAQVRTREVGTQTEECYFNPNIELMETTIKNLCERIQSLEAQLKDPNYQAEHSGAASSGHEDNNDISFESQNNDCNVSLNEDSVNESNVSQYSEYSHRTRYEDSSYRKRSSQKKDNSFQNRLLTSRSINSNDLVPIGDGHAAVPSRLLKHINWNSYTSATRKLLTAVFSRRILATHSLTGKPSPAFPNKPAKKKLDPALVNDIVQTVVERCSVPENVVRTSITTKCADESKMFRTRQKNKKRRNSKKNLENVPPITSESESDDL